MGLSLSGIITAVGGVAAGVAAVGTVAGVIGGGPSAEDLFKAALAGNVQAEAQLRTMAKDGNPLVSLPAARWVGELDTRRKAGQIVAGAAPFLGTVGTYANAAAGASGVIAGQLDPRLSTPWLTYALIAGGVVLAVVLLKR